MGILATAATTGLHIVLWLEGPCGKRRSEQSKPHTNENTHTNAEFVTFPQGRGKFLAVEMVFVFFYRVSG